MNERSGEAMGEIWWKAMNEGAGPGRKGALKVLGFALLGPEDFTTV